MMTNQLICPHCGTENDKNRGFFCTECGKPLLNFCTNETCKNHSMETSDIMDNDRYCPLCGSVTVFEQNGWRSSDE